MKPNKIERIEIHKEVTHTQETIEQMKRTYPHLTDKHIEEISTLGVLVVDNETFVEVSSYYANDTLYDRTAQTVIRHKGYIRLEWWLSDELKVSQSLPMIPNEKGDLYFIRPTVTQEKAL